MKIFIENKLSKSKKREFYLINKTFTTYLKAIRNYHLN